LTDIKADALRPRHAALPESGSSGRLPYLLRTRSAELFYLPLRAGSQQLARNGGRTDPSADGGSAIRRLVFYLVLPGRIQYHEACGLRGYCAQ
jgi:hypothetical protein